MNLERFYKQSYDTSTVLNPDKYDEGWVDIGRVITAKEALKKLR